MADDVVQGEAVEEPGTDLIPHPVTGEALALSAPTDDLGRALEELKGWTEKIREAQRFLRDEVLRRMDHEARYTMRLGGVQLEGDGPGDDYDPRQLAAELDALVARGLISQEARLAAVAPSNELKVKKRGVAALVKLGGEVAQAVQRTARPKRRSVKITMEESHGPAAEG